MSSLNNDKKHHHHHSHRHSSSKPKRKPSEKLRDFVYGVNLVLDNSAARQRTHRQTRKMDKEDGLDTFTRFKKVTKNGFKGFIKETSRSYRRFKRNSKRNFNKFIHNTKKFYKTNPKALYLTVLSISSIGIVLCLLVGYNNNKPIETKVDNLSNMYISKEDFPYHYLNDFDIKTESNEVEYLYFNEDSPEEYFILDGGTFELSGDYKGRIFIDANDKVVHLILNNFSIESIEGPAMIIDDAIRVVITLKDGSYNYFKDSPSYEGYKLYESCIDSNSDITINGFGTLDVYGIYRDGIRTNDTLRIVSGNINVTSKRTGMFATDGLYMQDGFVTIQAEKNGIKTTKNGINKRGSIIITGGSINSIAGVYTFYTDAEMFIYDCKILDKASQRFSNTSATTYVLKECFD